MPTNTCKVRINSAEQTTTTSAILCTKDTELYIDILTCPRYPDQEK